MIVTRQSVRLEEVLSDLIDYRGKSPPKSPTGTPVISAKVVKGGRILRPIEQTIDPEYYPLWMTRGYPRAGDVVMTTEGPLGEVAQLDEETATFAIAQRVVVLRGKPGVLDSTFLKFLLISPAQQAILSSFATGTTVEGISQKSLRSLPIQLPPFAEQRAIAEALGTLDAKLELIRRMNNTLEATAQTIFTDWLVDFGPTRAKMEGRAPYLAPDIWSVFPDRLDGEDRPAGWRSGTLDELMKIGPSEPMRKGQPAPYLDMAALPTEGPTSELPILREYSSGTRFRNGDALLARITPCLENGKTAFVQNLAADVVGWGSTEFIVMRAIPPVPNAVSYLLARQSAFRRHAIQRMTGTSGRQRVNADAICAYPITVPSDTQIWKALGSILTPIFAKIAANADETRTLSATRDILLPKLMSGEIRVKDAEKTGGGVL